MNFPSLGLSLKSKMLVRIGGLVAVGLALLIGVVSYRAPLIVEEQAVHRAEASASDIASDIQGLFQRAAVQVDCLASTVHSLKLSKSDNREVLVDLIRRDFEANKDILGIWACFEPNAYGGKDADHISKTGSDEAGRFSPYWYRQDGKSVVEPCPEYWNKDYYKLPIAAGKSVLLDPYWDEAGGKKILMASYAVPLYEDGKLLGVVGIDFDLSLLSSFVNQSDYITSVQGYIAVVSSGLKYVAHPKKERLGTPFLDADPWAKPFVDDMKAGKDVLTQSFSHTLNDLTYRVITPIRIVADRAPWQLVATMPRGAVLQPVTDLRNLIIWVGAGVLLAVGAVLLLVSSQIASPINSLAHELREGADHTSSAATQVSDTAQVLAQGATQQAAALEESTAAIEELSSMTRQNATHATHAKDLASKARASAEVGLGQMNSMQEAINAIKASSDQIAKIVQTIDGIAFQTNILALNAAVEAARAGESGAGFAVVAEEVRNLAQRSSTAARETNAMISDALAKTAQGVAISGQVGASLREISENVRQVDTLAGQVASATDEQNRGLSQINKAIADIDRITQANAASAEESASAAEELRAQSDIMKNSVTSLDTLIRG